MIWLANKCPATIITISMTTDPMPRTRSIGPNALATTRWATSSTATMAAALRGVANVRLCRPSANPSATIISDATMTPADIDVASLA